jgi:hypothetical protein
MFGVYVILSKFEPDVEEVLYYFDDANCINR